MRLSRRKRKAVINIVLTCNQIFKHIARLMSKSASFRFLKNVIWFFKSFETCFLCQTHRKNYPKEKKSTQNTFHWRTDYRLMSGVKDDWFQNAVIKPFEPPKRGGGMIWDDIFYGILVDLWKVTQCNPNDN